MGVLTITNVSGPAAGPGDDVFHIGSNQTYLIDGQGGSDTVVLTGLSSAYVLKAEFGDVLLTGDGDNLTLRDVEYVQFGDKTVRILFGTAQPAGADGVGGAVPGAGSPGLTATTTANAADVVPGSGVVNEEAWAGNGGAGGGAASGDVAGAAGGAGGDAVVTASGVALDTSQQLVGLALAATGGNGGKGGAGSGSGAAGANGNGGNATITASNESLTSAIATDARIYAVAIAGSKISGDDGAAGVTIDHDSLNLSGTNATGTLTAIARSGIQSDQFALISNSTIGGGSATSNLTANLNLQGQNLGLQNNSATATRVDVEIRYNYGAGALLFSGNSFTGQGSNAVLEIGDASNFLAGTGGPPAGTYVVDVGQGNGVLKVNGNVNTIQNFQTIMLEVTSDVTMTVGTSPVVPDDVRGFNLYTGSGNDEMTGGDGNDLLSAGGGANYMDGGKGDDTFIVEGQSDVVHGGLGSDTAVFAGNASDYVITHDSNGTRVVGDGINVNTDQVEKFQFADKTIATTPVRNDFNNDGKADILLQNNDGNIAYWHMNGATIVNGGVFNPGSSAWRAIPGVGDLAQSADGTLVFWDVDPNGFILGNPGSAWRALDTADFDGDAASDILFQHSDGSIAIWLLDSNKPRTNSGIVGNPGAGWSYKAVGDFNGDGLGDILFQNSDGTVAIWEMNGTKVIGGGMIGNPGGSWTVRAAGDFNGDGHSDILLQDASGQVAIWLMNGTSLIGGGLVGSPGPAWTAVQAEDVNGDGKADIIWQNSDGTVAAWLMNGTTVTGGGIIGNPSSSWHVVTG